MSYSWYRVDSAAADHPKVMELATLLGGEIALADGYVMRLWSWAQRYAPHGEFPVRAVPQLETYLGRAGVIKLMTEVGLVDAQNDTFSVHDWWEMQGALVEKASRDSDLKRKWRRQNGAKTARGRRADGARTRRDETRRDETVQIREAQPVLDELGQAWNSETTPPLPKVTLPLGKTRADDAEAALKRRPLSEWRKVFQRINGSAFLRGADGGWKANFDWAIRPEGNKPEPATRVLEGAYDRSGSTNGAQADPNRPPREPRPRTLTKEERQHLYDDNFDPVAYEAKRKAQLQKQEVQHDDADAAP